MFVSTGDSKKEYKVIDVICTMECYVKVVFCKRPTIDKMFDDIKEKLMQKAAHLKGDAVLNLKIEYIPIGDQGDAKVLGYGTVVRFL